ncbi:MAG: trypsin-like peptidase domain-containing protein, partial [Candidatus Obscuribacterales bacterium]|nr:trypsin-like peptidase domain-containing protein [Steroidobacteraceae bacterium]
MSSLDDLVPIALRACVLLSFISLFPGTAYAANPAAGNAPPVTPAVAPAASPTLAPVPAPLADTPAVAPTAETSSEVVDDDLATQPVSHAARTRLERARDSVVQIRGFFGESQSDAFHGSGFAATADGLIVTNYHVVSDAVLYPKQYRLEYLAHDGRSGKLRIHAIDIENDLAVVRGDNFDPPALTLRTQIPNKGDRAYSIGFPLNLGLTITEGVANGLVDGALEQRIHYSGAMNSGMSGGPALDSAGAVYGVNVSVLTRGQSVSFVVPAKHIKPLLARAQKPLPTSDAREQVAAQLYAHQAAVFAAIPTKLATYVSAGYTLPAKIAPAFECNSSSNAEANRPLRIETMNCSAPVGVYVQRGLDTGDIQIFHRVLRSERLHALQFAARLNRSAASFYWSGSPQHVAPFACTNEIVALHGFDARVSICVRQYRMFAELYDIAVSIVSLNQ